MKYLSLSFLLLLFVACSTDKISDSKKYEHDFKLTKLKPVGKKNDNVLGKLRVQLLSKTGRILKKDSASFGNCAQCVRGYSLSGLLGIRIVGSNQKSFKALRKQNSKIKIVDCPQGKTISKELVCRFSYNQKEYFLKYFLEI